MLCKLGGLGFRVQCLGFRVYALGFRVEHQHKEKDQHNDSEFLKNPEKTKIFFHIKCSMGIITTF